VIAKLMTQQYQQEAQEAGLTGRIRHRVVQRWLAQPVLALQVEVEVTDDLGAVRRVWRGARVEDLGELGMPYTV
jgi:hypothetical protein